MGIHRLDRPRGDRRLSSRNMIMGGSEGVIATIILGIVGAVVGGYLAGNGPGSRRRDRRQCREHRPSAVIGGVVLVAALPAAHGTAQRPGLGVRSDGLRHSGEYASGELT